MASLTSLQKRYERSLSNEDYYGAEQAIRMMHHRLTQNKSATPKDVDQARKILQDGALSLLQKQQTQAGTALALLLVKHYEDHTVSVTAEHVTPLTQIAAAYYEPQEEVAEKEMRREKLRFLKAAVVWSARRNCSGFKYGETRLNAMAAVAAAEAGEFELAQQYFIRGDRPEEFAEFLHEVGKQVLPGEKGLLLTRGILRLLAAQNVRDASQVQKEFARLEGWRSVEGGNGTEPVPLGNFCELVIKLCTLEQRASPLYTRVLEVYNPELRRDEALAGLCKTVGEMYFGIQPPPQAGLGGMMGSMLRGLMSQ